MLSNIINCIIIGRSYLKVSVTHTGVFRKPATGSFIHHCAVTFAQILLAISEVRCKNAYGLVLTINKLMHSYPIIWIMAFNRKGDDAPNKIYILFSYSLFCCGFISSWWIHGIVTHTLQGWYSGKRAIACEVTMKKDCWINYTNTLPTLISTKKQTK